MEQLFTNIQQRIAAEMPGLSIIDEDYGQLEAIETSEDTYPVTFPCVLISFPSIEWKNLAGGQHGNATVTVRLAIDCYDDTHAGSTTEHRVAERLAMAQQLHRCLQGFRSGTCTPLIRQRSAFYSRPHAIKVYDTTYATAIPDS